VKCAVIVAVYKVPHPWLCQCLDSIRTQRPTPGWEYEIRIGSDGHPQTHERLMALDQPHWHSETNVGPYLIRNSLIGAAPADAFAIFDADDFMSEGYLATLLPKLHDGICGSARSEITSEGNLKARYVQHSVGVCVLSASALARLGGYRPWRIAADADLIGRAAMLGIPMYRHPQPLYTRRHHRDSLTHSEELGLMSKARAERRKESNVLTSKRQLYVQPETVPLVRWP
jgi:hypothetical protein